MSLLWESLQVRKIYERTTVSLEDHLSCVNGMTRYSVKRRGKPLKDQSMRSDKINFNCRTICFS